MQQWPCWSIIQLKLRLIDWLIELLINTGSFDWLIDWLYYIVVDSFGRLIDWVECFELTHVWFSGTFESTGRIRWSHGMTKVRDSSAAPSRQIAWTSRNKRSLLEKKRNFQRQLGLKPRLQSNEYTQTSSTAKPPETKAASLPTCLDYFMTKKKEKKCKRRSPLVILVLIISGSFFRSPSAANGKPQLAIGPQKCCEEEDEKTERKIHDKEPREMRKCCSEAAIWPRPIPRPLINKHGQCYRARKVVAHFLAGEPCNQAFCCRHCDNNIKVKKERKQNLLQIKEKRNAQHK